MSSVNCGHQIRFWFSPIRYRLSLFMINVDTPAKVNRSATLKSNENANTVKNPFKILMKVEEKWASVHHWTIVSNKVYETAENVNIGWNHMPDPQSMCLQFLWRFSYFCISIRTNEVDWIISNDPWPNKDEHSTAKRHLSRQNELFEIRCETKKEFMKMKSFAVDF